MKNKLIKISYVIIITIDIFLASGWSFFELVVSCKRHKGENRKKWFRSPYSKANHPRYRFQKEYEEGKAWCSQQDMQECHVKSTDGLMLHGSYLPAKEPERFILLCHGYRGNCFGDFANIARFLHENHCNLLFIDQRCCGESEGEYITFGAREQYDVQTWAYYIARRNKKKLPIYLYGESMGAASVLMASGRKLPEEVRGIISDCGFRSMEGQIKDMAKDWFHLRWIGLLLLRLKIFCRAFAGFRMKDASVEEAMKKNKRPILFFHGEKDTYVNPINSRINFYLCRAPKELVLVPEARHLCSAYVEPELYRGKLLEFFRKYD